MGRLDGLEQLAGIDQMAGYAVEHTVDVAAALGCTVELCQIHKFVDGNADGDIGESHHLGYGYLHDDHIHVRQTREIPVVTGLAHIALISIGIEDGSAEQLACKLAVFLVLVFGQEFLVALVGRVEALDGLQYECIYYLFVVIPIETLLFQNGIELGIVLNEHL